MLRIIKKFNMILNQKQKIRVGIIVFLMLIGALMETMGVSLILPLMNALLDNEFFKEHKYAVLLCNTLGLRSQKTFLVVILLVLIAVFIIKDVFLYFEYYVQTRFICNNRLAAQRELMSSYLRRPYDYYLNASSGEITRIITSDVSGAFGLMTTIMTFFTEFIVCTALIAAMIFIDAVMSVLAAVILLAELFVIYRFVKPALRNAGTGLQKASANANKWVLQSIAGIKELKVSCKEDYFLEQYTRYADEAITSEKINTVLGNAPRLIIEAVTVSAMLAVMIFMLLAGRDISSLLPQLAAFALAAVRLLPSANRISTALNAIAYQEPMLDKMIENLKVLNHEDEESGRMHLHKTETLLTLEKCCGLQNITFVYPNSDNEVLCHADMVIPVGKSVGIVGTSGAGKTTAVDILLGLLEQRQGRVYTDGKDICCNYKQWLSMTGYIPQMIYMLDDTIRANVAFGLPRNSIDDKQVWRALEEAQLKKFVEELPQGLDTEIGERGVRLSGGQRQRIGIARALYSNPKLLIFDEATSALDNETETAIMESVNALHGKKTLIIIAHRLSTIQECDLVYRVENGKISILERGSGMGQDRCSSF